jgi:hypothetical protein
MHGSWFTDCGFSFFFYNDERKRGVGSRVMVLNAGYFALYRTRHWWGGRTRGSVFVGFCFWNVCVLFWSS